VAPDFNQVNVFWLARGTDNDAVVERILKKFAGRLRQELTELHVMGIVPHIDFVKGSTML
jgi:ribosome-binding factor A